VRVRRDLTDEQVTSLTDTELEAWSEAQAVGPWEPNDVGPAHPPAPATEAITISVPSDVLAELRAEATLRRQPWPRYTKDLLLLALRQVQATRRHPTTRSF
jgi:hypothetical protein